jgi:hypothetical protein
MQAGQDLTFVAGLFQQSWMQVIHLHEIMAEFLIIMPFPPSSVSGM